MHTPVKEDVLCFLCQLDVFGRGQELPKVAPDYVDISVTSEVPDALRKAWAAHQSGGSSATEFFGIHGFHPLRFVTLRKGSVLRPGRGDGYINLGDYDFRISYAWGGRHIDFGSETFDQRWSYAVRLVSDGNNDDFNRHFHSYFTRLYLGEGGWFEKEVSGEHWLRVFAKSTSIESWREKLIAAKDKWWQTDRATLLGGSHQISEKTIRAVDGEYTDQRIEERVVELRKSIANNTPIKVKNSTMSIREVMPESLFV